MRGQASSKCFGSLCLIVLYVLYARGMYSVAIIYLKATIQAVKKGVTQSGGPTQGEKVVKSKWQPRNGCDGRSMAKKFRLEYSTISFLV